MEIRRLESGATILAFPQCELKVALSILKAIYTVSKASFIREAVEDIEMELQPKLLSFKSYYHCCIRCTREIDERVGDNFVHYTSDEKDYWRHKLCEPFKPNRP